MPHPQSLAASLGAALCLAITVAGNPLHAATYCVDYQYAPNTNNWKVFDFSILSPYCQANLAQGHKFGHKFYGYISACEIANDAQYMAAAVAAGITFIGNNTSWNSRVVDMSNPKWATFVVEQLARPAVTKGYDGFFFDTMDSYYLTPSPYTAQEAGLVDMVKKVKAAFPTKKIIINRGFPLFSRLKDTVDGLLVEGLYYSYPGEVQEADGTQWLLGQIAPWKNAGKPIYILDYYPSTSLSGAATAAAQIRAHGFEPCIVRKSLDGTVLAPQPPPKPAFQFKNGKPSIAFSALNYRPYAVQYSENVRNSSSWVTMTNVAGSSPTRFVEVIDNTASGKKLRFYRVQPQ